MKKVVVVVDKDHKEIFESTSKDGKAYTNLEVLESRASGMETGLYTSDCLKIKEGDVMLASFTTWMYWRLIE